ncbi:hypothetical protein GE061_016554 [Apolygus lucorum]|uniref:Ionotropic glutamate receptor C-terminal domain-containing protein n=1 Tax=Apolygus lucorum TaxID=248454 RepID=A0A6A4K1Z7_APOLU|nr:hypothetical protein GE061_016554 [Apolygus lucorum]
MNTAILLLTVHSLSQTTAIVVKDYIIQVQPPIVTIPRTFHPQIHKESHHEGSNTHGDKNSNHGSGNHEHSSGGSSVGHHESGKSGHDLKESAKKEYGSHKGNKHAHTESAHGEKSGEHKSGHKHHVNHKGGANKKSKKISKGFNEEYHKDEKKSKGDHWKHEHSYGKFIKFGKKRGNGGAKNKKKSDKVEKRTGVDDLAENFKNMDQLMTVVWSTNKKPVFCARSSQLGRPNILGYWVRRIFRFLAMRSCLWLLLALFVAHEVAGQSVKLLVVKDNDAEIWNGVSTSFFEQLPVTVDREDSNSTMNELCRVLKEGVWGVLDLTWAGLDEIKAVCYTWGLPYVRLEYGITQYLRGADKSLTFVRKAPDAALIFQTEEQLDQSLFYLIRESSMRVILFNGLSDKEADTLINMRPTPNFNLIFADTPTMSSIFSKAVEHNLVRYDDRWILVFLDSGHDNFDRKTLVKRAALITPAAGQNEPERFAQHVAETLEEAAKTSNFDLSPVSVECDGTSTDAKDLSAFEEKLAAVLEQKPWLDWQPQASSIALHLDMDWNTENNKGEKHFIGTWNSRKGFISAGNITKIPRFFRVATGYMVPFAYPLIDPSTGSPKLDGNGKEIWEGYCIDLINRLAVDMNFEYELTTSYNYGKKQPNGSWDGLIGDLASGRVDIIVAALTMTSEREEVIDFVAPYFEQTGFSIVIRKPLRKTSLFKFMTVLRVEVWFSILAALCLTAFMIWFLDKYSPYSARNNKDKYPYPTREFTLRESFWFAVTSFTPQGGGEAPKSLSARTLVAAYWLFVVLMLATFTANLAAFLTVERMQSPVQSLKQLARQSRINYTVVQDSDAHSYFRNMKNAEETLYRVWKEITLNASANQSQYRVWDYPIKEQYGHILISMEKTGTVQSTADGFQKVRENEDAEFALIHDALEIKYEVYRDCNLTEIGEPFAEQPYSIAVQQGSHLNEEISRRILDLQKDRYFESLSAKYWNSTLKGKCDSSDEDEGITLESLGGVFIATLFGLVLAMLTLGIEIMYERKGKKNVIKVKNDKPEAKSEKAEKMLSNPFFNDDKLFNREFGNFPKKPSKLLATKPKVSFITVFPRDQLY